MSQHPVPASWGELLSGRNGLRSLADAMALYAEFKDMMESQGRVEPNEDRLEDGIAFVGVAKFPARVKCAMLGWAALVDAVARAKSKQEADPSAEQEKK